MYGGPFEFRLYSNGTLLDVTKEGYFKIAAENMTKDDLHDFLNKNGSYYSSQSFITIDKFD